MKALKTEHKWALICLKYIPVLMFLTMWIYTILALFGIHFILADTIMGCAIVPSIMIFSLTKVFQFCWLHKAITGYALIVDLLINIDFYATFGVVTSYIQITVIIIGLIMFLMLLFKIERFKNSFTYLKLRKYDAPINYYSCEQPKNAKRSPI